MSSSSFSHRRARIERVGCLGHPLVAVEARVGVVGQLLESGVAKVHRFEQEAVAVVARAVPGVDLPVAVLADGEVDLAGRRRGDRSRHEIDGAAHGLRPVHDRRRPLQHAHLTHALHQRKIVGGRRGIRRRPEGHAVLHQRDLRASIGVRAAKSDVRTQADAVLGAQVHAGHGLQDRRRVVVLLALELLVVDDVGGARRLSRRRVPAIVTSAASSVSAASSGALVSVAAGGTGSAGASGVAGGAGGAGGVVASGVGDGSGASSDWAPLVNAQNVIAKKVALAMPRERRRRELGAGTQGGMEGAKPNSILIEYDIQIHQGRRVELSRFREHRSKMSRSSVLPAHISSEERCV